MLYFTDCFVLFVLKTILFKIWAANQNRRFSFNWLFVNATKAFTLATSQYMRDGDNALVMMSPGGTPTHIVCLLEIIH